MALVWEKMNLLKNIVSFFGLIALAIILALPKVRPDCEPGEDGDGIGGVVLLIRGLGLGVLEK